MGNTGGYFGTDPNEALVHKVTISQSFYMSKYEVQQILYKSVMATNPSNFKGDYLPVERVSWYMAVDFCNKLSERDGFQKCYNINGSCDWTANGYRLPTEAEWEYACKAGTTTDFYTGNLTIATECEPIEKKIDSIGWYCGNANDSTHIPGLKKPNKYGLYDIIANVWELCWDWLGNYTSDAVIDPKGPSSGTMKVARGGSWHNSPGMSRAAMRGFADTPDMQSSTIGLRLVRIE